MDEERLGKEGDIETNLIDRFDRDCFSPLMQCLQVSLLFSQWSCRGMVSHWGSH